MALPTPTAGARPAWHLYVVRADRPDELAERLRARAVEARAYYRRPVHEQPAMRAYAPARPLPGTDEAARRHLALPMSAVLTRAQCVEVTGAVRAAQRGGREKPATVRSS